jgi:hypothetical protein
MLIMADHETVQVLANTEIEKFTRIIKSFRLQNVILGTNMTTEFWSTYFLICSIFVDKLFLLVIDFILNAPACIR